MTNSLTRAPAMIAITFALPDESRAFVARLEDRRAVPAKGLLPVLTGRLGDRQVMVIHTGVGEVAAYRERLRALLAGGVGAETTPRLLVSSGYTGGLRDGVAVGDLILAENFSHPEWLQRAGNLLAPQAGVHTGALITQPAAAETAQAKRDLGTRTGSVAVDMETAWIAAVCSEARVPMLSLRVVSDAVYQAFPVPGNVLFDARRQRPRYLALPVWLLLHPARIAPFVRFVRGLEPARSRLAAALQKLVMQF